MNKLGLKEEEIVAISKKYDINDEKVIKFITEVVNENNNIINEYLEREYPNVVKNNMALSMKRMR